MYYGTARAMPQTAAQIWREAQGKEKSTPPQCPHYPVTKSVVTRVSATVVRRIGGS